jgi:hypothetical protein
MTFEFRRGKEHIAKANEAAKSGGGDFRPFLQTFYWADDQDTQYLGILNPADDIPTVQMQKVWTKDGRPEYTVARTDPKAIGASSDPIEEQWGYKPQDLNICIAVSLTPTFELVRGRDRPVGFEVETRTFERKLRDKEGEPTGDVEELTSPVIGLIAQSPNNFGNHVSSLDTNVGPIHELPMRVTRIGDDRNTDYEIELFEDKPLDLTNLFEFFENISYLDSDLLDELMGIEDEAELAVAIGSILLDKRLDEMAQEDYYNEVLASIDTVARYPSKKFKGHKGGNDEAEETKTERPKRQSQRRSKAEPEPKETKDEAKVEEKPKAKAKPKRARSKPADPAPVTKASPVRERLEALKAKTAEKANAA